MLKSCTFYLLSATVFAGTGFAANYLTGQAARAVIGQGTFTLQQPDGPIGAAGGIAIAANTLFIADDNRIGLAPDGFRTINNRVLMLTNLNALFPNGTDEIAPYQGRCPLCGGQPTIVLGQPDMVTTTLVAPPTSTSVRQALAVASDGQILVVADTGNNRVLIWKSIPASNQVPADIVLGQPNFSSNSVQTVAATSMRGPQGVWVQNGKLFVADSGNNRVLIWNSIPTQNGQAADLVLGQPNFTTAPPLDIISSNLVAAANTMLSPTSVTSDGTHLFVSDLGFNRVLIWNSIPTSNDQNADVQIGQKDFVTSIADDTPDLCSSTGTDSSGNPIYPSACGSTLNFPRFALADNQGRLYIADGGNDRILVFNSIPTGTCAAPFTCSPVVSTSFSADAILGQVDEFTITNVSTNTSQNYSASNQIPTPTSLAWDGQNLYVADPTDYRILVFTPGTPGVPIDGIVNAASRAIYAAGSVSIGGTITANDTVTVTIGTQDANGNSLTSNAYTYTILSNDTTDTVAQGLTRIIQSSNSGAGDPNVYTFEVINNSLIQLVSRVSGSNGNNITLATSTSTNATITATASGVTLTGGNSASNGAPGMLITLMGSNLAPAPVTADLSQPLLPFSLGGVEVYIDGIRCGLISVSPTEVVSQIPYEVVNSGSVSAYLRMTDANGNVTITNAVGIPISPAAPGLFACDPASYPAQCNVGGQEPRIALAYHASSYASATISVDGTVQAGDVPSITIGDRTYTYTVVSTDTLSTIQQALVNSINATTEERVTASVSPQNNYIVLTARVPGPAGDGITVAVNVTTASTNTSGPEVTLTAVNSATCCSNVAGRPITPANPAQPGEQITLLAAGLGLVTPDDAKNAIVDFGKFLYQGANTSVTSVSATVGAASATVLSSGLMYGTGGIYQIDMVLAQGLATNAQTQVTISAGLLSSNIVTIAVGTAPVNPFEGATTLHAPRFARPRVPR